MWMIIKGPTKGLSMSYHGMRIEVIVLRKPGEYQGLLDTALLGESLVIAYRPTVAKYLLG